MVSIPTTTPYFSSHSAEATVKDFITLLKPGVMTLVVFSGWVGIYLAPGDLHPFLEGLVLLAIALGSGASGALNMWYDRDIDALMKRTQSRPIPAGRIAPQDALAFGMILAIFSIILMGLSTNYFAATLLAFSIFFYAVIYTMILKRTTAYNIVIGGAAGAFPPLIGWVAATNAISPEAVLLFFIIFLWTPPHFWALALTKVEDYKQANIPMLPNVVGEQATKKQILIYSFLLISFSYFFFWFPPYGWIYGSLITILNLGWLFFTFKLYFKGKNTNAMRLFIFSIVYLFLLLSALVLDHGIGR
ncbi:MAG: heme o synthase [Candidatus Paracaedimonas acanthamoebae]|uniref:Protoheme IX farnesyltransferase n=1 Tax=Candidatus Paracaedimonas acanthamoebae TaxID=244581 RepID=A0A8J7TUW6_9PROT|nr:heme o synthase [Candidatus Paracaedimonas acanthamoebae]